MDLMKKYMQQEDEMDFMPIIPLNEGDGDGADEIQMGYLYFKNYPDLLSA